MADRGGGPGGGPGQWGSQGGERPSCSSCCSGAEGVVRLQLVGGLDGVRRERVGGVRRLRSGGGGAGPGPGAVRSGRRSRRSGRRTGAGPVRLHRALEIFQCLEQVRSGQVRSGPRSQLNLERR